MSRCFPYPPPGDEKRAALIESIKLQKGKEKAKKERKKEKKRGKKEKSRGDNGKREEKQQDHRKRPYEEFLQADNKLNGCLKTTREDESAAQLERSSLTEELGPAVAQNICDSSDSTQNSSKRRKHESAEISHGTHGNGGLGLRIRLPLVRHKDLEPPPPPPRSSVERPCFSGRRIETVPAQRETRATGHDPGLPLLPSSSEQPCFSGRIGATPSEEALAKVVVLGKPPPADAGGGRHHHHTCGCSCDSDARRQYKKLIRDWNPPPLQAENPEPDDQDWLFARKASSPQRLRRGEEPGGQVAGEDLDLGNALCAWPPRACYLPDVGVYALPYVVPL